MVKISVLFFCFFSFVISGQIYVSGNTLIYTDSNVSITVLDSDNTTSEEIYLTQGAKIIESTSQPEIAIPQKSFAAKKAIKFPKKEKEIEKKIEPKYVGKVTFTVLPVKNSFQSVSFKSLISVAPVTNNLAKTILLASGKTETQFQYSQKESVSLQYFHFLVSDKYYSSFPVRPPPSSFWFRFLLS